MEWKTDSISQTELERKQAEYIKEALDMAKKAKVNPDLAKHKPPAVAVKPEPIAPPPVAPVAPVIVKPEEPKPLPDNSDKTIYIAGFERRARAELNVDIGITRPREDTDRERRIAERSSEIERAIQEMEERSELFAEETCCEEAPLPEPQPMPTPEPEPEVCPEPEPEPEPEVCPEPESELPEPHPMPTPDETESPEFTPCECDEKQPRAGKTSPNASAAPKASVAPNFTNYINQHNSGYPNQCQGSQHSHNSRNSNNPNSRSKSSKKN